MTQRCAVCGTTNSDDLRFCVYCGASLPGVPMDVSEPGIAAPVAEPEPEIEAPRVTMNEPRPPRRQRRDFVGLVGLGFFLLILGVLFYMNQNLVTDLRVWWDQLVAGQILVRPPEGVITSGVVFWGLIGVTKIILAPARWVVRRTKIHTLGAVLGGIGTIAFAYLLTRYAARDFTGWQVAGYEAGVIAFLLVMYVGLGLHWSSARRRMLALAAARRSPRF